MAQVLRDVSSARPRAIDDPGEARLRLPALILDARAAYSGPTLANLYDPDLMPPNLRRADGTLDRAVDRLLSAYPLQFRARTCRACVHVVMRKCGHPWFSGCPAETATTEDQIVMRLALVNDVRTEPVPNVRGKCCLCGDDMISKCGQYVRWHWAHKTRITCDPWQESETDWHRYWKDAFPIDCQEVVHIDGRTKEKHIADVKTPAGFVVEVQHSPIAEEEARSREVFYRNMIWIVDAQHLTGWFSVGMAHDLASCCPMMYQVKWWGSSKLLDKWSKSRVHVYFDVMDSAKEYEDEER